MLANKLAVLFLTVLSLCCLSVAFGAETSDLFSPAVAEAFREKAISLYTEPNATISDARQALVFLSAADILDKKAGRTLPDMVRLAWRFPTMNIYQRIYPVFLEYTANDDADLEVLRLGVQYLLEPTSFREEREQFLARTAQMIGMRHQLFASDIATQLGLLAAERADMKTALFYLMQAYNANPYNKIAFQKLLEVAPTALPPGDYIQHLRRMMGANPYDFDAAYAFANSAYNVGLYGTAASAYEYCADLFAALHPNEPLPPAIYLPWLLSAYNEPQDIKQCPTIAHAARKGGQFNLYLEAIAGNAALKLGNAEEGNKILAAAAQKAAQNGSAAHDLAWFYCFAQPNSEKALEWANKANAADANSPRTAAILAYALVMNGQYDVAKPLIEQDYRGNQIAGLAMGQIQIALDPNADPNATVGVVKSAIALDAGSLEAQRGKELLAQKGSTYVPIYETAVIEKSLQSKFGDAIVNKFVTADKIFAAKITTTGNDFSYGGRFNANLAITNKGDDPLTIFDGGLFNGNIRVDAVVKGDLNERIPNLVIQKIRPSEPIAPRRSLNVPLKLIQGKLAHLLLEHPQASVEIEFTAWLDPVTDANGTVRNALAAIAPVHLTIKRNGVDVSGSYLQTRLGSLTQGQPGQKMKSAQLFAGLLLEQKVTAGTRPYKMLPVEAQLLRAGLAKCLADGSWTLKVETMLLLDDVRLDYNLTSAASENLDSDNWPVRMAALWLLGKDGNPAFKKVRDWAAEHDSDAAVIEMAVALGAPVPQRAIAANPVEPNLPVKAEPNMPARATAVPVSPALPKTAAAEPNQPEQVVVPEPNQQLAAVIPEANTPAKTETVPAEPNQPQKAATTEPNQAPKKSGEPNDVIEDILKS